jgi:L-threonylcarbamoyladenylate synthase
VSVIECRTNEEQAISAARDAISRGELIVLPTDTVYGVGADPFSVAAVNTLLTAKGRGREKPSPVLVASLDDARRLAAVITPQAQALMEAFWPGALTVVVPARPEIGWDLGETNGTVALRMPDDAFARKLLTELGPLAVSSANLTGHAPALTVADAQRQLGSRVAVYLDGGQSRGGEPSTVVIVGETLTVVREGAIAADAVVGVAAGN